MVPSVLRFMTYIFCAYPNRKKTTKVKDRRIQTLDNRRELKAADVNASEDLQSYSEHASIIGLIGPMLSNAQDIVPSHCNNEH